MERRRRSWIRSTLWLGLAVAAVWLWFLYQGRIRIVAADEARMASALALEDLEGRPLELADYAGQVVVVNVWASWCGPCRTEVPGFANVYDDLRGQGLVILGLNVDDLPVESVARQSKELGMRYPVVLATNGFSGSFENPAVIPHSWLIDREGRLRASHAGYLTESALRLAVQRLLDEP